MEIYYLHDTRYGEAEQYFFIAENPTDALRKFLRSYIPAPQYEKEFSEATYPEWDITGEIDIMTLGQFLLKVGIV